MVVIDFVELARAREIVTLGAIGIVDIDRHSVIDRARGDVVQIGRATFFNQGDRF